MIQQGLSRKKECEAKALAIVQRLALADCVDREWLRDAVSSPLNQFYTP